jgi:hypothetical protein
LFLFLVTIVTKFSCRCNCDHPAGVVGPLPSLENGVIVFDEVDVEVDRRVERRRKVRHVRESGNPRWPNDRCRSDLERKTLKIKCKLFW